MVRLVRLTRNGNSTCLVVPRAIMRELGLARGHLVALAVENGAVRMRRVDEAELMRPHLGRTPAPPRRRPRG